MNKIVRVSLKTAFLFSLFCLNSCQEFPIEGVYYRKGEPTTLSLKDEEYFFTINSNGTATIKWSGYGQWWTTEFKWTGTSDWLSFYYLNPQDHHENVENVEFNGRITDEGNFEFFQGPKELFGIKSEKRYTEYYERQH